MRFKRFSTVLVFSLLSGVGLIQYLSYKDSHPSTEDAYVQAHIVNIASRVSGPVIKLHVSENDYVNAGDVLFEIDPSVFDAIVQGASANYELAAQSTGASDAEVGVAKSTLEERKVSLSRAKRALERATSLAQTKLISEAEFDDATATYAEAKASVASANADLRRAESESGAKGEDNARLREASAQRTAAELDLAFTKVIAPVSGWITNLSLREGAMVIARRSQFSIVENSEWWVEANFKETDLKSMRPGQQTTIEVDMYPDLTFQGHVESLGAGSGAVFSLLPPENATGNWVKVTQRFPVRISIESRHDDLDEIRPLRVGASATVTVDVRE
ncbi:MAG: secretion protein [Thiotrichales bacterium]|nr:secretion protein [Thiotrichales bacterium]